MPHAVEDDEGLAGFLDAEDLSQLENLEELNERELDTGEKANDAEDFGDISDEDLAEDESEIRPTLPAESNAVENDAFDDLFGDEGEEPGSPRPHIKKEDTLDESQGVFGSIRSPSFHEVDVGEEDAETREQRLLFEQAHREREERLRRAENFGDVPPPPATDAELFSAIWPQFEADKPPRFNELLPGKRAYYLAKTPLKPPKPVHPTKVKLEIQQDQEKSFKLPAPASSNFQTRKTEAEAKGLILIADTEPAAESSDDEDEFNVLEEPDDIGGVTWQDLVALCADWEILDGDSSSVDEMDTSGPADDLFGDDSMDAYGGTPPVKKRKTSPTTHVPLQVLHNFNMAIDDPERSTARLAKKVHLDLNDPDMLVDIQQPNSHNVPKSRLGGNIKRDAAGGLTKDIHMRYNISNDEAYELLKENHQSKIRSLIGNTAIEHALPAIKLQYPFYKRRLTPKEARSWHRPSLNVTPGVIYFEKPAHHKRKNVKGKDPPTIFAKAKDLSVADNSSLLLLEYSEEYPAMLSSFGMGSRLINYYRRKDNEDSARPKFDVGETSVLLPQDKSPFSIFGDVDRGTTTPTISNSMYRAPVFRHTPNHRDFIISRSWTSVDGSSWSMRNMENLFVVGQEFPSVEVPGTHSRKVTDAAKRGLKMFSFRAYRRHGKVTNEMVLGHLPGSDVGQNRSKMREFMDYDKVRQSWVPRGGVENLPEEPGIRAMIKPEDVSLLYAMQVGDRQLQDAGYNKGDESDDDADDENEKEKEKEGQSLDEQLAPWQTTKNFLNACQGKAMVALHGEGDPTGRGEAFNFVRTSMKGGFKEIGESIEDRLDAKKQKELGGHKYNVAKQQKSYNEAIRRIWEAQQRSLSSTIEHDDVEMENGPEDAVNTARGRAKTPNSSFLGRDDNASSISKSSSMDQSGKILKITRTFRDKYGKEDTKQEIVRDPKVINVYLKRRKALDLQNLSYAEMKKTGDAEKDAEQLKHLNAELERLYRNKDRRQVREKAKGIDSGGTPDSSGQSPSAGADDGANGNANGNVKRRNATGTTQRKCANCGQVGHIKTNKKWCSVCLYMHTPMHELNPRLFKERREWLGVDNIGEGYLSHV